MVIEVGKLAGNAIVPYSQTTKKTKKYAITVTESTSNNYSDVDSWALAYADSNDNWFLHFHIHGYKDNNTTSTTLAITGVTFASESDSTLTVWKSSLGYASRNTSNVVSGTLSSAASTLYIDGLVALESEPTWAAANMEASTNASIYIEPASASQAGLLDNNAQAVDGVKTFNDGVKLSSASDTLNLYEDAAWTPTFSSTTNLTSITSTYARYTRIGNIVFCQVTISVDAIAGSAWTAVLDSSSFPTSITGLDSIEGTFHRATNPANTGSFYASTTSGGIYLNASGNTVTSPGAPWIISFMYRVS